MSQTFAELKNQADDTSQVRKVLEGVAFLAPLDAPIIESLTDTDGNLKELPEGYWPVGVVSTDGYTFGSETNVEDVEGFGYGSPVRRDIVSATKSVTFTALESFRKNVLALAYSMNLDAVEQAVSGEVMFDRPVLPEKQFYRLIVIGKDGSGAHEYFRAKHYPRVYSTSIPEEAWGTGPVQFAIELSVEPDKEIGTDLREFIAGPGAKADASVLGFVQSTP
ncbi:hypothetical protein [Flaviflexus massiliensis]|uniref:hypothetical protein n=1 Tax=Flaviflexus massiliensis TaxID=1522309 RepID=UPI0006D59B10|nr:hypothetical protein [Flaviflexus massiliensis]